MKKLLALGLATLLTLGLLVGCGGSSTGGDSAASNGSSGMDMGVPEDAMPQDGGMPEDAVTESQPVKKIYRGDINAETTDFEAGHAFVQQLVAELGGYFASSSVSDRGEYRYGDYTIRVPADKFQELYTRMGESIHVTYQSQNEEDITSVYYDTKGRLTTQEKKLQRLQELLAKADTMSDIITIESAISETEYTIEQLTGEMKTYDNQVDYATVYLTLHEVYKLSGDTAPVTSLWGRLGRAFVNGLKNVGNVLEELLILVVYNWVWLLILAAAVWGGLAVRKRRKTNRILKSAKPSDPTDKTE